MTCPNCGSAITAFTISQWKCLNCGVIIDWNHQTEFRPAPFAKPPLGLQPQWMHDESRQAQILAAMTRYSAKQVPIPDEWILELHSIVTRLRSHHSK